MSLRYVEDVALLSQNKPTGLEGVESLLRFSKDATPEVINILKNECDIILECRYCRNLFRSVPNFLTHKRTYCRGLHHVAVAHVQSLRKALEEEAEKLEKDQAKKNEKSNGNLKRTNIIGALNKRSSDIEIDSAEGRLVLHTLPRISKEVPVTVFENGIQKVLGLPVNLPQKESIPEDKVVVVMPQDHSSKYREMQLRNRRDAQGRQEAAREYNAVEIAILEKCQVYYPQWPDAVSLRCSHPDCSNTRSFSSIQTLVYHIALKHGSRCTSDDRFPCLLCKFTLKTWNGYMTHLLKIHKSVRDEHEQFRNKEANEVDKKKVKKSSLRNRSMSPPPNPEEEKIEPKDEENEDSSPPIIHPVNVSAIEESNNSNDTDDEPPQLTRMARTRREIKVPRKFRSNSPVVTPRVATPSKSPASRPPSELSCARSASPCSSDGNNISELEPEERNSPPKPPTPLAIECVKESQVAIGTPVKEFKISIPNTEQNIVEASLDDDEAEIQTVAVQCHQVKVEEEDSYEQILDNSTDNLQQNPVEEKLIEEPEIKYETCEQEPLKTDERLDDTMPSEIVISESVPSPAEQSSEKWPTLVQVEQELEESLSCSETPIACSMSDSLDNTDIADSNEMSITPEPITITIEKLKRPASQNSIKTILSDISTHEKQEGDSDSDSLFHSNEKKRRGRKPKTIEKAKNVSDEDLESPAVRPSRNRRRPEWMDFFVIDDEGEKKSNTRKRKEESSRTPEISSEDLKIKLKVSDYRKRKMETPVMESALSEDKMKLSIRVASPLKKRPFNTQEKNTSPSNKDEPSSSSQPTNINNINYFTPNHTSIERESSTGPESVSSPGNRRKQSLPAVGSDPDDVVRVISDNGKPKTPTGDLSSVPVYLSQSQKEIFFSALHPQGGCDRKIDPTVFGSSESFGPYVCKHCGFEVPNLKEGRRHMVGHIRVMRLKCTLCGAGSFFCTDMRSHLMERFCPALNKAPPNIVRNTNPCMSRADADKLTEVVDKSHPGRVMYTSGKIVSQANRFPYFPDPKIEEAILGRTGSSSKTSSKRPLPTRLNNFNFPLYK